MILLGVRQAGFGLTRHPRFADFREELAELRRFVDQIEQLAALKDRNDGGSQGSDPGGSWDPPQQGDFAEIIPVAQRPNHPWRRGIRIARHLDHATRDDLEPVAVVAEIDPRSPTRYGRRYDLSTAPEFDSRIFA